MRYVIKATKKQFFRFLEGYCNDMSEVLQRKTLKFQKNAVSCELSDNRYKFRLQSVCGYPVMYVREYIGDEGVEHERVLYPTVPVLLAAGLLEEVS